MAAAETITSAVEDAVKDTPPPKSEETQGVEETTQATEKTTEVETKAETKVLDNYDLSEVERQQALQLFAGLKDPKTAPSIIKFFADQAGPVKTETRAEEVKDEIQELIEALGPEFEIIGKRLGPAISKIIDSKLEKGQADIRTRLETTELDKLAVEADSTMSALAKEYFGKDKLPDDVESDMNKAMDRMQPASDMSVDEFVRQVFSVVAFKRGITAKSDSTTRDKVNRNRNDAASRLASERGASPKEGDSAVPFKSLKQAIEAAVETVSKE